MMMNSEERNYMSIECNKGLTGIAIFRNKTFIVCKDFFDTQNCERVKTMIYKFCIDTCICTLDVGLERFDALAETGVEVKVLPKLKRKKLSLNRDDCNLGLECLNMLDKHLGENSEHYCAIVNRQVVLDTAAQEEKDFLVRIGKISKYNLYFYCEDNSLFIGHSSIAGLNLFGTKTHPNKFIQTERHEFSLFSYINHCQTRAGAEMLKMWISFPLTSAEAIAKRKEIVEFVVTNKMHQPLVKALKRCGFVDETLKNFTPATIKKYLKSAGDFYRSIFVIRDHLRDIYCFDLDAIIPPSPRSAFHLPDIAESVDPGSDFVFKAGTDPELDRLKEMYHDLPKYLDEVACKVASEHNNIDVSIIYFPQLGYLIETSQERDWDLKFKIADIYYYKNNFIETLDSEFGDLKNRVNDIEIEMTSAILQEISRSHTRLRNIVSTIDCFVSLAVAADKFNLTKGEVHKDRRIELVGFVGLGDGVENTITIDKNLIITGSNGSGKSTLLRNVAHIVILNQMGSFVPCKHARLPIFDKIFTKITSKENTSSFRCDLLQVSESVKFATRDSLVLIDEFGKGSDLIDGVSLLLSITKNFDYPRILLTTHFQNFIFFNCYDEKSTKKRAAARLSRSYRGYEPCRDHEVVNASRSTGHSTRTFSEDLFSKDTPPPKKRRTTTPVENEAGRRACVAPARKDLLANFSFLANYRLFFLHSVMRSKTKRFTLHEGIYLENEGIEYSEKFGFPKDFIFKCRLNKEKILLSRRKKRNDQWAVKVIQKFISE